MCFKMDTTGPDRPFLAYLADGLVAVFKDRLPRTLIRIYTNHEFDLPPVLKEFKTKVRLVVQSQCRASTRSSCVDDAVLLCCSTSKRSELLVRVMQPPRLESRTAAVPQVATSVHDREHTMMMRRKASRWMSPSLQLTAPLLLMRTRSELGHPAVRLQEVLVLVLVLELVQVLVLVLVLVLVQVLVLSLQQRQRLRILKVTSPPGAPWKIN